MPIAFAALVPHPPILLPVIGAGRERAARRTLEAYAAIRGRFRADPPDRLLLISTHGIVTLRRFHLLTAALSGSLEPFGAADCSIRQPHDPVLAAAVRRAAASRGGPLSAVDHWEPHDHSAIVPLMLLGGAVADLPTTVVSISFRSTVDHYALGRAIAAAISSTPGATAIIASGDGAHTLRTDSPQGYRRESEPFQRAFESALERWDIEAILGFDEELRRVIDESVVSPAAILGGILHAQRVRSQLLAAEAPWGVAYTTALLDLEAAG